MLNTKFQRYFFHDLPFALRGSSFRLFMPYWNMVLLLVKYRNLYLSTFLICQVLFLVFTAIRFELIKRDWILGGDFKYSLS